MVAQLEAQFLARADAADGCFDFHSVIMTRVVSAGCLSVTNSAADSLECSLSEHRER
jgi:hypothetical protein